MKKGATAFSIISVGVAWYCVTSLFYEKSPANYKAGVEDFFTRLKRPIEDLTAAQVSENTRVVGAIGGLCLIFGTFVLLMMLVPNPFDKRLGFLFSGSCFLVVGWLLRRVAARNSHGPASSEKSEDTESAVSPRAESTTGN